MPWTALDVQTDAAPDHVNQLYVPTSNIPNLQVHAILVQARPTNTGRVVFGDRADIVATVVSGHVLLILPPPTLNIYPSANAGVPLAPAALDLKNIYWCVEVGGDGFICSYLT